ncbi:MAG: hypothetical protein QNJ16_00695 [Rhodobacter sp.]|nr:hypothetical protein [Rhodobacter sp.]
MGLPRILCAFALPVVVAACAQQEERPVIRGQLLLDKMGNEVGCDEGVFVPGAPPEFQCRPPDDRCDPQFTAFDPDCPPPGRRPNGGSDDGGGDRPGGNQPGGNPAGGPNNPNVPGRVP